jgi:hypothetical protein
MKQHAAAPSRCGLFYAETPSRYAQLTEHSLLFRLLHGSYALILQSMTTECFDCQWMSGIWNRCAWHGIVLPALLCGDCAGLVVFPAVSDAVPLLR